MKLSRTNNIDLDTKELQESHAESSGSSRAQTKAEDKDAARISQQPKEFIRTPGTSEKMKQAASDVVSTYLKLTRTLGLEDTDALSVDNLKVSFMDCLIIYRIKTRILKIWELKYQAPPLVHF